MPFLKTAVSGGSSAGLEVPLTLCLKRQTFTCVYQNVKRGPGLQRTVELKPTEKRLKDSSATSDFFFPKALQDEE